jgi:purine-binding chemotaxis protein CheW
VSARIHDLADDLRREFDRGFAAPPPALVEQAIDFLVVGVADDLYALRITALRALVSDRRIVALPTPMRELAGVVAVRGAMVPVYTLRALLGKAPAETPPARLVVAGPPPGVGLAFDRLERHLRVAPGAVAPATPTGGEGRQHVRQVVVSDAGLVPVLEVDSVLAEVERRVRAREGGSGSGGGVG